jgi:hypothetical protein
MVSIRRGPVVRSARGSGPYANIARAREGVFGSTRFRENITGTAKKVSQAINAREELAKMRGMSKEEFEAELEERNAVIHAHEFEGPNSIKIHSAVEERLYVQASEKLMKILPASIPHGVASMFARQLAEMMGHKAVMQLSEQKLLEIFLKSPIFNQVIAQMKKVKRMVKVDKATKERFGEELQEAMQQ